MKTSKPSNTAAYLSRSLGQPLDRRESANIWRSGFVYVWSPVFNSFVAANRAAVTIRPNEDLSGHERSQGGFIAIIDR